MAIPLAQLIQEMRETAAVQNSQIVSDQGEMPRIVNQAVSNCYDTVVKSYAPYFAEKATFTVDATGIASLAEIINPSQSSVPLVNGQSFFITDTEVGHGLAFGFALNSNPAYYRIDSFTVSPSITCDTGNTTFQIMINGVTTGDIITIPNGSISDVTVSNVNPIINVDDNVTINITCAGPPGGWFALVTINVTLFTNNPPFYKELGVDFNSQGRPLSVPRLDSFLQRNQNNSAISSVEGDYTLWYTPSCPVLDDVTDLPTEMERFRTMILLEGAIMIMLKRREDVSAFERRLQIKTNEIMASLRNRSNEPKAIPLRGRNGGCGRAFDLVGPNIQIFRASGYVGDYFWGAR